MHAVLKAKCRELEAAIAEMTRSRNATGASLELRINELDKENTKLRNRIFNIRKTSENKIEEVMFFFFFCQRLSRSSVTDAYMNTAQARSGRLGNGRQDGKERLRERR